ncbi:MAG TPA: two-component regulator propeller domain-containing protein, partial [Ferruginibacter sp.]|nr:two-component regulator propeller domain-containing protein [Ferruginibacter sp.]
MRILFVILISIMCSATSAQPSLAFTRISIDDGLGLSSNVVYSLHQDKKGFIWVGTSNGLQRFDGSKFISFTSSRQGSDQMPDAALSQIVALNNGKLLLAFASIREFGLFDPSTFLYKKIAFKVSRTIPARAQFNIWKTANGDVYMNVLRYGIMQFDLQQHIFRDTPIFNIPKGWSPSLSGGVEDVAKKQIWFACDSGLVVYNQQSGKVWHKYNNPQNLPILNNRLLQDRPTEFYIDQQKRI